MSNDSAATREIHSVLVANRGEIACRVIESVHAMGLRAVAVYSDADAHAPHVAAADTAVRLGPAQAAQSYLDIEKVVAAAVATGADAVHPGYGFLSENQQFAAALAAAGIVFIGPPASAIATMGDKIAAREAVSARGVPVVPGLSRPGLSDEELIAAAPEIGFPVLIKPSAGGGGKGMHRVEEAADLPAALVTARREAAAAFGDDTLFLEHFVDTPRHIEVQVLADEHGNVIHLGERECSLQRRHQKVIEEAPSALLDAETRERIGAAACDAARSVGYTGAGTVEFIVSAHRPDEFFFMEMNTRLQVEHPVTEMVTGIDLVEQQIRVARGEELAIAQEDVVLTGHAVEARVYAEDPAHGFLPTGGTVEALVWPPGWTAGVRVDSGIETGSVVGSDYDPMLAKVICHGRDRTEAIDRLDEALARTSLLGVGTNIDFCRFVLARPEVRAGVLDTELLDRLVVDYSSPPPTPAALVAAALGALDLGSPDDVWGSAVGFRIGVPSPIVVRLDCAGQRHTVSALVDRRESVSARRLVAQVSITGEEEDGDRWDGHVVVEPTGGHAVTLVVDGTVGAWVVGEVDGARWVAGEPGTWVMTTARALADGDDAAAAGEVHSPMPGSVVAVPGTDGDVVAQGDPLVVVEAMKMEHTLRAPRAGTVTITVAAGDKVTAQQVLARVTED
ncbi:ATP-grasp domain-containing protein [Gordonia sp. X0973]|uniref:ATP-binding protein n=1 Tax=Gordonia sp. X0973 TaxID=2742602 RepID=UPI000F54A8D3|nr:biotin carboxylase N-terminal domain-containing protein [Gordonia sp. X0973]QKT06418.1 ATP-grasp domain-containing protein [Gordonia sp. X0973]